LAESAPPLAISVDLDVAVGSGGAMAMNLLGNSENAARDLAQALDVADLDKPPTLVAAVPPSYPPDLRRARVEGVVSLVFMLSEEGMVEDARVESSSRPEFERPALEAIRRWRFKPGMKNGEAVKTYMRQPIRFRVAG
jgi:protein TonB